MFEAALSAISEHKVTIVLGVIEKDAGGYYNTAAVIRQGKLLGTYRKVHLFERNFLPGDAYPVFTVDDLRFGVNVCYDARFPEGAADLSAQGAKVVFYPLNNRLPIEKAAKYREKHIPNLVQRAKESGCLIISSDVIAQDDGYVGYGCTVIINPRGEVTSRVQELETGMIIAEIV